MGIYAEYWHRNHVDDQWRCNFTDTDLLNTASPSTFTLTEAAIAKIALSGDDPEMRKAAKDALDNRYKVDPGLAIAAKQALETKPKEPHIQTEPATVSDIFTKKRLNIGVRKELPQMNVEPEGNPDITPE